MVEDQQDSRTEEATQYKLDNARKKGIVARGQDLGIFFSVAAFAVYLWGFGPTLARNLEQLMQHGLVRAGQRQSSGAILAWLDGLLADAAHALFPLMAVVILAALTSAVLQAGISFSPAALKPDFSRLNPANGFKRVFSIQIVWEVFRSILKMLVYVAIALLVVWSTGIAAMQMNGSADRLAALMGVSARKLLFFLALAAAAFAALDQIFVRRQFAQKMRMSRRELRDEHRHREGDPRIKQRRRQLQQELRKRARSMRNVRNADVLIVNPTHYAVGLSYLPETMSAPNVIAKGAGDFALRLKRLAFIYGIPTIEDPKLARHLYLRAKLGAEIPNENFRQTAAIYSRLNIRHKIIKN